MDLDDIFADSTVKNVRAVPKFQPKAKPRPPKKVSAVPSVSSSQSVKLAENEVVKSLGIEDPSEHHDSSSRSMFLSENVSIPENVDTSVSLLPESNVIMPDSNEDWRSCFEKTIGEHGDIFLGFESFDDFLPHNMTTMERSVTPTGEPDISAERFAIPVVSRADDSVANGPTYPELSATQDALNFGDTIVSMNEGGPQVDTRLEKEQTETYTCLETSDMPEVATNSGWESDRQYQHKPTMLIHMGRSGACSPNADAEAPCQQNVHLIGSEFDADKGKVPAFPADDVLDFSSLGFDHPVSTESMPDNPVNEDRTNLMGASDANAEICAGQDDTLSPASQWGRPVKGIASGTPECTAKLQYVSTSFQENDRVRSLRPRKKHVDGHQLGLVDESEDEAIDNVDFSTENLSDFTVHEEDYNDEEFQLNYESQAKGAQGETTKPVGETVQKRKNVCEEADEASKRKPKKFSHSTWRRRRIVDKTLLETPTDEIDFQKVPLRDLILLAEHKERVAKKEAATLCTRSVNQSASNSTMHYKEDAAFASERDVGTSDEQANHMMEETTVLLNYHTYMDRTRTVRWSKQDTELFYQGVRQFGTDLSMIQQLFPGRTRQQVKLKYKKEERQQPLRLREALTNRAKDHSHFQQVIERLQQIAAEEKQQNARDNVSVDLTGEDMEGAPEAKEEEAKCEHNMEEGVEDIEQDIPEAQSPTKQYDSEDDMYRWSQYKSEV